MLISLGHSLGLGAGLDFKFPLTLIELNHLSKLVQGITPLAIARNIIEELWHHGGSLPQALRTSRGKHLCHLGGIHGRIKNGSRNLQRAKNGITLMSADMSLTWFHLLHM